MSPIKETFKNIESEIKTNCPGYERCLKEFGEKFKEMCRSCSRHNKKINSIKDIAAASVDLVEDLISKGYQLGEIIEIADWVESEVNLRCNIANEKRK